MRYMILLRASQPPVPPPPGLMEGIMALGEEATKAGALLDTAGYVSFNLGTERSDTAIVAAASAPYAVIPVVAGVLFFHERPTPVEWAGVGLVIAGLVLLGLAVG